MMFFFREQMIFRISRLGDILGEPNQLINLPGVIIYLVGGFHLYLKHTNQTGNLPPIFRGENKCDMLIPLKRLARRLSALRDWVNWQSVIKIPIAKPMEPKKNYVVVSLNGGTPKTPQTDHF